MTGIPVGVGGASRRIPCFFGSCPRVSMPRLPDIPSRSPNPDRRSTALGEKSGPGRGKGSRQSNPTKAATKEAVHGASSAIRSAGLALDIYD